jgi:hypothetical protein
VPVAEVPAEKVGVVGVDQADVGKVQGGVDKLLASDVPHA